MTPSSWWKTSCGIFICRKTKAGTGLSIAVEAVSEVGNPTILATFAVIAAVLPMAFVGGLMGPYMRPIPIGASAAMFWSLAIAFIVTPWASIRILRWGEKYSTLDRGHGARRRRSAQPPSGARGGFLHAPVSARHETDDRAARAGAGFSSPRISALLLRRDGRWSASAG